MSDTTRTCTVCQGKLEEGLLGMGQTLLWRAGPVVRGLLGGRTTRSSKFRHVTAWCCMNCGHLELYALPRPERRP